MSHTLRQMAISRIGSEFQCFLNSLLFYRFLMLPFVIVYRIQVAFNHTQTSQVRFLSCWLLLWLLKCSEFPVYLQAVRSTYASFSTLVDWSNQSIKSLLFNWCNMHQNTDHFQHRKEKKLASECAIVAMNQWGKWEIQNCACTCSCLFWVSKPATMVQVHFTHIHAAFGIEFHPPSHTY